MKRRNFLKTITTATAGTLLATSRLSAQVQQSSSSLLTIREPFDGAILHERHGNPVLGTNVDSSGRKGLRVLVQGGITDSIDPGSANILINGRPAILNGRQFQAEVVLSERENVVNISLNSKGIKEEKNIRAIWHQTSFPRYRLQIDDNSFFLRDIHQKNYKSLFDSFYLSMYRDLHRKYGSKFTLNIFNSTPERDFALSNFSDKYKSEWEDNADWLRLAFHAENEFPNCPYEDASPEKLGRDFDLVASEIRRFAGKAYRQPGVIHWGTVKPEAYKTLYDRNVRVLSGYFIKSRDNRWPVCFQLPDAPCEYLSNHDGWMDYNSGLIFSKVEFVVNGTPLDQILPKLEKALANPNTAEVIDLLTHEQYFWSFYKNYLPDHPKRLDRAFAFLSERGYKPVFLDDGFYGA
ncbi:MAG: hypothetical protein PHR77_01950 [Kiritimatiellae bacterium]|nr:hypothetical protein [Kiritimatiellia bacterium]MDD5519402.1 hypothetical protein [Kiritimatiellia bacterium]